MQSIEQTTQPARDVVFRSQLRRSAETEHNGTPMYSLERIRRRALCEAVCDGIPDEALVKAAFDLEMLRVAMLQVLPDVMMAAPTVPAEVVTLEEMQRRHCMNVLLVANNHAEKAAAMLGIAKTTLYRWLQAWKLEEEMANLGGEKVQ